MSTKAIHARLGAEARALADEHKLQARLKPDEWLVLLDTLAELDAAAEATLAKKGRSRLMSTLKGERKQARRRDLPDVLRETVRPIVAILREDSAQGSKIALEIDVRTPLREEVSVRKTEEYYKAPWKVVDTFYEQRWLSGRATLVGGAELSFAVIDHVRERNQKKHNRNNKLRTKTKVATRSHLRMSLELPAATWQVVDATPEQGPGYKLEVQPGAGVTTVHAKRTFKASKRLLAGREVHEPGYQFQAGVVTDTLVWALGKAVPA